MNSKILIGIVAIIVIVGAIILMGGGKKSQTQTPANNNNSEEPTSSVESQPGQAIKTANVDVTDSGFSPASVKVKQGTTVIWNNKSGGDISINSDDHPTHRLYKELNIGHIPNNISSSVLFEKPGTYTYHDHYNPERKGTIIVE